MGSEGDDFLPKEQWKLDFLKMDIEDVSYIQWIDLISFGPVHDERGFRFFLSTISHISGIHRRRRFHRRRRKLPDWHEIHRDHNSGEERIIEASLMTDDVLTCEKTLPQVIFQLVTTIFVFGKRELPL